MHRTSERKIALTQREWEIIKLIAQGLSNRAIGDRLFISPVTVHNHVMRIYQKLDIHSRVGLVLWYQQHMEHRERGEE